MRIEGVYSVLPTPFHADGSLDLDSLRRVVDLYVGAGINGVTALGVTSEVARLNERERDVLLDTVIAQVNGRVPVVAGTSAEGLRGCIERSRRAKSAGAGAVMVSPPRMEKLNSDAVFAHFSELASAADLDIVVQDYPPISGYTMEPALLLRIARDVPRARTIKLEDPPTPLKTARILEGGQGVECVVLGGLGGMYLLEELLAGAQGTMTGFAYPEMLVEVVRLFRSVDIEQAAQAFYRYVPLMRFEFQQGIGMALRKEMLLRRGAVRDAALRAPGSKVDASSRLALDYLLGWMRQQGVKWISG